jgi:phytoene dehydrogenase-like protein
MASNESTAPLRSGVEPALTRWRARAARASTIAARIPKVSRMEPAYDVVVIGSGPNGFAAAITCARAGLEVLLVEGASTVGGGSRSAALTLPGYTHDVCSAIHPLAVVSPFFRRVPLAEHGLSWVFPEVPLAHPLDGGNGATLERSLEATAASLEGDGEAYERVYGPFVRDADALYEDTLAPLRVPRHPLILTRFGLQAMRSTSSFAREHFEHAPARALAAGCGAHSFLPLDAPFTAAFSLMLGIAGHSVGWPCARGGSQQIADAMAKYLRALGGTIVTLRMITSMEDLPPAKAYLFDVFPHALAKIAGERLPARYRAALDRYRHAPGVFKVDWALSSPIPWTHEGSRRAGTVHVGGALEELEASEAAVARGKISARPFVLVAQQTIADATRAPPGKHTGWAYCHVPNGSTVDMTAAIEAQIERFAPGFGDCIEARHVMSPADYGAYNPNNAGGDIAGGATDILQLFSRPVARPVPYATPAPDIFLCSASTPPGGGVHGMCGYFAARAALRRVFGKRTFVEEEA